jgi:GT2 family glycosyltransferase
MAERLQQPDIGAVGPISNFVMGLQNADYNKAILLQEHYTKFLIGFFMMIKREAVEKVGLLDECFGLGGNDDLDYSIRLRQAGYKLKILRNVFIQHKGFASLGKVYKDYKEVEDLTRPRLVEKWGKTNVDSLFEYDMKTLNEGD